MPAAETRAKKVVPPPPPPKPKAPPPPPKKLAPKPLAAAGGPQRDGLAQTGKGTFQRPVDGGNVTSRFGPRTLGGKKEFHSGLDIAVPEGTPVKAAAAGKVIQTGHEAGGAGNYVVVDHGGGFVTRYMHLSKIEVKEGQTVQAGEEIAKSGNTGRSTGPHLHFQVEKDGKPVDPEPYLDGKPAEINLEEAGKAPVAPAPEGGAAPAGAAPGGGAPGGAAPGGGAPGGAPGGAAPGGGAPAGDAPGGAAAAAPAVKLGKETTNLLELLKQAGLPAELLALLLELLQSGQLDEQEFQELAKKFLKGDATQEDLQALAEKAKQNPPKAPKPRDGMAPGTPNGPGEAAPDVKGDGKAGEAAEIAKKYLGTPYVFGGASPGGFDCSGLVQYSFKKAGINLPRTAAEQYNATKPVSTADAQPGDLVFLKNTYKPGISHVGIYLGNGKMLEAPKTGDVVKITSINDTYKQQHWAGIRRAA